MTERLHRKISLLALRESFNKNTVPENLLLIKGFFFHTKKFILNFSNVMILIHIFVLKPIVLDTEQCEKCL